MKAAAEAGGTWMRRSSTVDLNRAAGVPAATSVSYVRR